MTLKAQLESKFKENPRIQYEMTESECLVVPKDEGWFKVGINFGDVENVYIFGDNWHLNSEYFSDNEEAISTFFLCIRQSRLKIISVDEKDCIWTIEFLKEGEWVPGFTYSDSFRAFMFWKKRRVRFCRNILE